METKCVCSPSCGLSNLKQFKKRLFQEFSDVAAGVRVDVGGLGGNHAGAADGVFAEEESLTDLLADVGGGVREAMVVEEQGVHRFAARNRRGVDDRDALRSGLGAGKPARLGEDRVTGIHKVRNLVSETERNHIITVAKVLLKISAQLRIVAADKNDLDGVAAFTEDFLDRVLNVSEAHAAGHNQKPFLVRVHIAIVKYALSPRLTLVGCRLMENAPHRDAERMQFLSREAFLDTFLNEVLVRNDVVVELCVFHERDAGVVGHHEHGLCGELALALEGSDGFRREYVYADHYVESILLDVVVEMVAVEFICVIYRRFRRFESIAHRRTRAVGHGKELCARREEIYLGRAFLRLRTYESHSVLNFSFNSL